MKENLFYIEWVVAQKLRVRNYIDYMDLFGLLDSIPYRYENPMDAPRLDDGLYLREEYYRATGHFDEMGDRPCSVFEMLAMFAYRIDSDFFGDPKDPRPDLIFMIMIENVHGGGGIKLYNKAISRDIKMRETYKRLIERWLDGDYFPDGTGSIFPIQGTERDLRKVNLWSQMNEYFAKNRI